MLGCLHLIYIVRAHENLADILIEENKYAEAFSNYDSAIFFNKIDKNLTLDYTYLNCLNQKFIGITKKIKASTDSSDHSKSTEIIKFIKKEISDAKTKINDESNKLLLINIIDGFYKTAITFNLYLYRINKEKSLLNTIYTYTSQNKALLLKEGIQSRNAFNATLPDSTVKQEKDLSSSLTSLTKKISKEEDTIKKDSLYAAYIQTKDQHDDFIKQLENDFPKYYDFKYAEIKPLTLQEVQSHLKPNQLYLDYYITDEQLICFSVSQDSISLKTDTITKDFLKTISDYRESLENNSPYKNDTLNLYNLLLQENIDRHPSADHIIVSADGLLHTIPFEAFQKDGTYLIEDYAVSYVFSNDQLVSTETDSKPHSYVGFGTNYSNHLKDNLNKNLETRDLSLSNLIFADREIKESANFWNGEVFYDSLATKENFLKNSNNAKIAHLALHGIINDEYPDYSAILFDDRQEDNMLHTYELYQKELDYDLVILSSCNSGNGKLYKGEGIKSMARGFAFAGCPSIVSSMWAAYDEQTAGIVSDFNKNLSEGMSKAKALQKAKVKYINTAHPNVNQPKLWANLILIGNTEPVVNSDYKLIYLLGFLGIALLVFGLWRLMKKR